ncbi:MAG: hypothetical protein LUI85_18955 [Bacteroides sp.]|nr:hypothetical protein [Bacteroides sp.]
MMDFTGHMSIKGKDAWTEYGAYLCELSPTEHTCMDELHKMPKMKACTTVSFRERNGEQLPDELPSPCFEAIDRTLQFCIRADSESSRQGRYNALMSALKAGWLTFQFKGMRDYKMYMSEPSAPTWYGHICHTDPYVCTFKVKFREPEPII